MPTSSGSPGTNRGDRNRPKTRRDPREGEDANCPCSYSSIEKSAKLAQKCRGFVKKSA